MQLSGTVFRLIEQILQESEVKPADAAMRLALRSAPIPPDQKRLVSEAVFTYFRWFGWLDSTKALRGQLELAFDLADRFRNNSRTISDRDLQARAVPAWIHEHIEISPAYLRELQSEPPLWLRARPGRVKDLANKLSDAEPHESVPDALCYQGYMDLFLTPEFHQGEFEIQDLSSQIVGHVCSPAPGQTWWDACAGEGGKMLHLGDLMQNKGLIWATDPKQWRLDILKRRAGRAGIFNYRAKAWANTDQLPTKTKFDGILVDAPCTGVGTWGRNPHARWTTVAEDVSELAVIQTSLVQRVAELVKPGGTLVYSVCTLTKAETTQVADAFEKARTDFKAVPIKIPGAKVEFPPRVFLRPETWQASGMYIATWKREG